MVSLAILFYPGIYFILSIVINASNDVRNIMFIFMGRLLHNVCNGSAVTCIYFDVLIMYVQSK